MSRFTGVWPALITAYTKDGRINGKAMQTIIDNSIAQGASGFYVCGSTGESYLLSIEERMECLETVMDAVSSRVPVICHIGAMSTNDAVTLAKHADSIGVDAVSSVPPFYFKYSRDEYLSYYRTILDNIDVPILLYNVPAMSGISLTDDDIAFYFQEERIIGLKFTSYDLFQFDRIRRKFPEKTMFYGHDELFLPAISMGAEAAIGSSYNFATSQFVEIRRLLLNGENEAALKLQSKVNAFIEVMLKIGIFRSIKAILSMQGIDCGDCRPPFAPITANEAEILKAAFEEYISKQ